MKRVLSCLPYIKKIWAIVARPQIVVCLVFVLMVGFSSWYIDNIFRQHLIYNAQTVLDSLETNIKSDLLEPRTALGLRLDRISEYVIGANLGTIGNGFLLGEQMEILSHPDPDFVGKKFDDLDGGYPALVHKLRQEHIIPAYRMKKYDGVSSVFFIRQLENGWHIGIVTPENIYYQELGRIRVIIIFLGITLAYALIVILLEIVAAKNNTDERMRVMLNAMPLGASYHDSNFKFLDCNQGLINLFGLPNKQEYCDRFNDL
jgi:PAS domain-containing protein